MAEACAAEFGGIDILINNAGIQHVCPVDEFPVDKWRQMQPIMVDAPFLLIRSCLPYMKAKGWGRIISTASAHASVASPNKSAYIAAKHGVLGLTPDTMRTRGLTREQVLNDVLLAAIPQRKFVMPDQVAAMAVFLCTEGASAITGANLAVDGGWTTQ